MRIQRVQIFGFGKWVDETFEFKNESFICFYGKNESGKSTLQQFFLYMLFGLPPRKLAKYKPKYSRQIGGLLTIQFPNVGEVTIERVENQFRLLLPNGEIEKNESVLVDYLNDLQEETYRAIYGFSSLDLVQFHTIKQAELSDLLFSVSLTGSTGIYEMERKLTRELDELFKKTGRRPIINEQITKVNKLEKEVHRTKQEVLTYRDKIDERDTQQKKLQEINNLIEKNNHTHTLQEKTLQFLPQIRTYKQVKNQLATLSQLNLTFPENGIDRYEQLKQQLVPITAEINNVQQTIRQYDQTMIDKRTKLLLPERYDQMVSLVEQSSDIKNKETFLSGLTKQIIELNTKINEYVNRLHMTEKDVSAFQAPFHATTTWKQLIDESNYLQNESERIEEEAEIIDKKRQKIVQRKQQVKSSFVGMDRLQEMRNDVNESEQQSKQYSSISTLHAWEKDRKKQSVTILYIISFIALIFFIISFVQKSAPFLTFGSACLVMVGIQFYYVRKSTDRIHTLSEQLSQLGNGLAMDESVRTSLQDQEDLASELTSIKQALQDIQIEQLQWDEKHNHFALKEHKWISAVELEREKHPLLQQIELDYWIELLQHIEKIKEKQLRREQLLAEQAIFEQEIASFNEAVREISNDGNESKENFTVEHLQSAVKRHDSLIEQIEQYAQLKREAENRLAILIEEKDVIEHQMTELLSMTNVTNEEDFYKTARHVEEKSRLQTTFAELDSQLQAIFSEKTVKTITAQSIDEFRLQREVEVLQAEINQAQAEQVALHKSLATLQVEIEQLESSNDYSYATHVYELERDKLNTLAEEWAAIKVAQATLQHAKVSYQQKYITDVMAYTSSYFRYLTSGRYTHVYSPTETNSFQVEATNKMRYTVEELSKGTIDQLYVALRFAISKVMSEKFIVPLMIDDAFIHFDDERASLAVQLLEEVSQEQQVILYTCRDHVANSVNETTNMKINL